MKTLLIALAAALSVAVLSSPAHGDVDLEATLQAESHDLEQALLTSPRRYADDDPLVQYIAGILCRLADESCSEIRLHVLRSPEANAFMLPNGAAAIHTGLLLRFEDEAQLANVLAHEVAHYLQGHSLQRWKQLRAASGISMVIGVAASATGEGLVGSVAQAGVLSNLFSYNRAQEREADRYALARLTEAGYPLSSSARLWQALHDEDRARPSRSFSVFSTHPPSRSRARSAVEAASEQASAIDAESLDRRQLVYLEMIAPYRSEWLQDDLSRRSVRDSAVMLSRLRELPLAGGELAFFHGELLRRSMSTEHREESYALLSEAVQAEDAPPVAWRSLGQVARALGMHDEARLAFTRYLELVPDAPERQLLETAL